MCLQAIKEALDTIQPSMDSADREKDLALNNANDDERARITRLMEQLNSDWNRINGAYNDRHRWMRVPYIYHYTIQEPNPTF